MKNGPVYLHAVPKRSFGSVRSVLLILLCTFQFHVSLLETGYAGEAGLLTGARSIGRKHTDSNTIGSEINLRQAGLYASHSVTDDLDIQYTEDWRVWDLAHPDGTLYYSVAFSSHTPRLNYQVSDWRFNTALSVVDVKRQNELYSAISQDDSDRIILPAVTARHESKEWYIQGGGWQETDIQVFNYRRYSLFIYETVYVEAGINLIQGHNVSANVGLNRRTYPAEYDLEKRLVILSYRLDQPAHLSDHIEWRQLAAEYTRTDYSDTNTNKLVLSNRFKFRLWDLNHFLTHQLEFVDSITTYREGPLEYSLIETDQSMTDLVQMIDYSGFTPINNGRFYLTWRYVIEDSIIENVSLDQRIELKVTYPF